MTPHAVSHELGPKQLEAVNGPEEAEISTYQCQACGGKFVDLGLYFYGTSSTKCIWCSKFPKAKKDAPKTTVA
jgi:hypothetical protein